VQDHAVVISGAPTCVHLQNYESPT
jgi:hypothetical protein